MDVTVYLVTVMVVAVMTSVKFRDFSRCVATLDLTVQRGAGWVDEAGGGSFKGRNDGVLEEAIVVR